MESVRTQGTLAIILTVENRVAMLPSPGLSERNIINILSEDVSEMLAVLFSQFISIQNETSSASHLI